jgi:hypothetical protein
VECAFVNYITPLDVCTLRGLHPWRYVMVLCPCIQWCRVCSMCLKFDRMEGHVLECLLRHCWMVSRKGKLTCSSWYVIWRIGHEEHDWLCLVTCGLVGIVIMNQVGVLPYEFHHKNVMVKILGFACCFGHELALSLLSYLATDEK